MSNVVDNLYVVGMGLGVVFVGLISIIILCYIIGAICMSSDKKTENAAPAPAAAKPAPDASIQLGDLGDFEEILGDGEVPF